MPLSPAPIQNVVAEETGFATRPWVLWAQGLYSTILNHNNTLQYFSYNAEIDRLLATKAIQTTEASLYFGYTLKANVAGQEVGYKDEISGNNALNPYRLFDDTNGTKDFIKSTAIEDISNKPDNGFEVFQPDDSDILNITSSAPIVGNFTQLLDAFNSAQRVRGISGKMAWRIESPTAADPSNYVTVFDGKDYGIYADFDNPTNPLTGEVEIYYPFDIGYRAGQILRLTFYSFDGEPVQVKGSSSINLPYFATRFQNQTFETIYTVEQKPRGVACMEDNTSVTTIASTNAPVKIAGSLTASANNRKFSVSNNRLEYTGDKNIVFDIYAVASIEKQSGSGSVDTYRLDIYKNGVRVSCGGSISSSTNNQLVEVTSMADVELTTGDYIEMFITNLTGAADIVAESMTVKAVY